MQIGDLVKHKKFEQYGIITNVLKFSSHSALYYVVFWQCGNKSGLYGRKLEAV